MPQRFIGSPETRKVAATVAKYRLVETKESDTSGRTVEYSGADSADAEGITQEDRSAADVTAGLTSVAVQPLTPGQKVYLEAAGVIGFNKFVKAAANGRIDEITENATPVDTWTYGKTLEAATAAGNIIEVFLQPGLRPL